LLSLSLCFIFFSPGLLLVNSRTESMTSWLKLKDSGRLIKVPGHESNPLRANIVIHIFYKSLVYFAKQKQF
jgi:hypothetical protein